MAASTMFNEEQINKMKGLRREPDFIEVQCGCTSRKYGDTIGKLKIFANGQFLIDCVCTTGCKEGKQFSLSFQNLLFSLDIFLIFLWIYYWYSMKQSFFCQFLSLFLNLIIFVPW